MEKKYGLQLRIPKSQSKPTASRPPAPPPAFAFGGDDEDDVEREISRQASKNKALQKVEEQHKKALEEDPSVFDYDGVYDEMKEKIVRPKIQDKTERKSKYIEVLMDKAKQREREHEIIYEKKLLKERSKDDHLFADKEKFVTSAYKKKLAEQAKWLEEERLQQIREEKEDVTKKKDLSDFYFGLNKNVAFGARLNEDPTPTKHNETNDSTQESQASKQDAKESRHSPQRREEADREPKMIDRAKNSSEEVVAETVSTVPAGSTSVEDEINVGQASASQATTAEHYKRSEDALAAARERFMARKRAREQ
ncbi:Nuclear speckle splicing regulatory protein 1 [Ananas comosus]|uniref:Nuclear speckle splicing regulatory protein 1 n=2 Tax=Ananas comosus TaxID=4615 RepID=A0A199UGE1_ANACO|nr:Nuclear speckle splicing regulatory protein 1 [Ananas comosus]CAD1836919.1 unnamed protein product [Ananas comosus var. bracteatus]